MNGWVEIETSKGKFDVRSIGGGLEFRVREDKANEGCILSRAEVNHLIELIESREKPDFRHHIPDARFLLRNAPNDYVFNFEVFANGEARVMYGFKIAQFGLPALWFVKSDMFPRARLTVKGLQDFYTALKSAN